MVTRWVPSGRVNAVVKRLWDKWTTSGPPQSSLLPSDQADTMRPDSGACPSLALKLIASDLRLAFFSPHSFRARFWPQRVQKSGPETIHSAKP